MTQLKEPMFNIPPVVTATVVVLALVHVLRTFVLTEPDDVQFLLTFAFIPARYDSNLLMADSFPGGFAADLWTFVTYAFIHADLMHIGLNVAWLIPFGTALARRFGPWRYTAFMLVTAAAGAAAHLVSHVGQMVPMIGASAAISGAMAASMRFVLQRGAPLGLLRPEEGDGFRLPAAPLLVTFRDPRFLIFLGVWIGLNTIFGLGTMPSMAEGQDIAWQAHVGGFAAGLFLFAAFDPVGPRAAHAAQPGAAPDSFGDPS